MSGKIIIPFGLAVIMVGFQNCASPKFDGVNGGAFSKLAGSEDGTGQIPNGEDGSGRIPNGEDGSGRIGSDDDCDDGRESDDDNAQAAIPVQDFLDAVANLPAVASQIVEDNRCYISHGGGHGMDLCLSGDKTELLKLWPIEVKGNSICAPAETVKTKAALFKGATVGECP